MNQPLASSVFARSGQTDFGARFTTAEFLRMGEIGAFDGMKVELVHGELVRMTPPMNAHSRMQGDILFKLMQFLRTNSEWIALPKIGIDLGDDTLVGCDVAIARRIGENRLLRPDEVLLAIEIASTTLARDMGPKRQDYARAGVANYWVVDLDRRLLHRFAEPTDGEYLALASLRFGEKVPVPVPGTDQTIIIE